jgi:hypothetical protein
MSFGVTVTPAAVSAVLNKSLRVVVTFPPEALPRPAYTLAGGVLRDLLATGATRHKHAADGRPADPKF